MDPEQNTLEPTITDDGSQNNAEPTTTSSDVETKTSNDLEIELKAMRELLQETKDQNSKLQKDLEDVKLTNAKLVNSLDLSKTQVPIEDTINGLFNSRYK